MADLFTTNNRKWQLLEELEAKCQDTLLSSSATKDNVQQQKKIQQLLALKAKGIHYNEQIQENRTYRNPSIYQKLVEYLELDDRGNCIPTDRLLFNPSKFPTDAYCDERYRLQRLQYSMEQSTNNIETGE